MDCVLIEGLEVEAVIGVLDWERGVAQRILVDLTLGWDNRVPAQSGELADALDYAAVAERVGQCLRAGCFYLLETAAEAVSDELAGHFGVGYRRIVLRKPGAVSGADSVGVAIERGVMA